MTASMVICLTLFVLMMVSLAMNKVPMGVTGLATLAALVIFKCIEAKDALSCFGNANVIIIVGCRSRTSENNIDWKDYRIYPESNWWKL